ncbi:MAG: DUF790 family protein [Acidobacteria bacterium]|nr:DUF790 family protein [Acidobacteriota bacterium]
MSWRRGQRCGPRYINADDPNTLRVAEDLIALFHQHQGQRRGELEQALEAYVGVGTDYQILRGLIKLLMDRCLFDTTSPLDPAAVRQALFLKARHHHPVIEPLTDRQRVLVEVAEELNYQPEALLQSLYADLPENQRLIEFNSATPTELLDEYNLAQAQALLYRCIEMRIWIEPQNPSGYRRLFDAVKAYRLIHTICGTPQSGYEIRLDGPVSMFHRSQKYGVQMAVFLPALLRCRQWRMRAEIEQKRGSAFFELTSEQSRLRPHGLEEPSYQPPVGEKLMANWARRESPWLLQPSHTVINLGENVFIPDLVFRQTEDQTSDQRPVTSDHPVYLEVLGFWTPRWLKDRLTQLERAGLRNFLLAASTELCASREPPPSLPPNVILFQSALDARVVEDALNSIEPQINTKSHE